MAAKSKFDPNNTEVLISRNRHREIDIYSFLARIPIRAQHVVADIGCGPGYFTIPLAKHLCFGKVYAMDVQQQMLELLIKRLNLSRLTNVDTLVSQETVLPLKDDSLDGALVAFVLQEAEDPEELLRETKRCLRSSGWVVVMEWYKRHTDSGPPVARRIDPVDMKEMLLRIGFRVIAESDLNTGQYMIVSRG